MTVYKGLEGSTTVYFDNYFPNEHPIPIDGASTAKFELLAHWDDLVDDPGLPDFDPTPRRSHTRAFETVIPPDATSLFFTGYTRLVPPHAATDQPSKKFPDTRYRRVTYKGVATTRFKEYFTDHPDDTSLALTQETAEVAVDVLSSAHPAAPKVKYVVPTFGWTRDTGTRAGREVITSTRRGNGLRVYLDRPWYSSGDGEMLAVLLPRNYDYLDLSTDPRRPTVTVWGDDPAYSGRGGAAYPRVGTEHFKNAVVPTSELLHLDLDGNRIDPVDLAAYTVAYDRERRLWYADIEIDAGPTYFPFVRLALSRYQPKSISGLELSPVVVADVAQLTADRVATLLFDPRDGARLDVAVGGLAGQPIGLGDSPVPLSFQAALETREDGRDGALAWVPVLHDVAHRVVDAKGTLRTFITHDPLTWDLTIQPSHDATMLAEAAIQLPRPRGAHAHI